jgi:hypothetical protein
MRIYDQLLGLPSGRASLTDRLDEAAGQLRVELAAQQEADAELEALRTAATRVLELVPDNVNGSSSLAASMSAVVELLEDRIDATATNNVYWVSHFVLVTAMSHFLELKSELVLLGSRRNADLTEVEVDALWTQVHMASNSLASYVPSSVAHITPNGAVE